jgi:hypothetical protein
MDPRIRIRTKMSWIRTTAPSSADFVMSRKKIGLHFRGYLYLILEDEERVHDLLGKYSFLFIKKGISLPSTVVLLLIL